MQLAIQFNSTALLLGTGQLYLHTSPKENVFVKYLSVLRGVRASFVARCGLHLNFEVLNVIQIPKYSASHKFK
jgi:hypothetical protein